MSAEPMTLADLKAIGAASAESGPERIEFLKGHGEEAGMAAIPVETPFGNALFVITTPPAWASPRMLKMFSDRATSMVSGICPSCGAARGITAETMMMVHENDCDVSDEAAIALWQAEQDAHYE
jgi:hypothetical protein